MKKAAAPTLQKAGEPLTKVKEKFPIGRGRVRAWKGGKHSLLDWTFQWRDYGVGKRFMRKLWKYPEPCYWTVTKVKPKKIVGYAKRGQVWGRLTWRGVEDPTERVIRGVLKREWRYIPPYKKPPIFARKSFKRLQPSITNFTSADPEVLSKAFTYRTLKKESKLRNEEELETVYEIGFAGDVELRHAHLYDFNKPKQLAREAEAREKAAAKESQLK